MSPRIVHFSAPQAANRKQHTQTHQHPAIYVGVYVNGKSVRSRCWRWRRKVLSASHPAVRQFGGSPWLRPPFKGCQLPKARTHAHKYLYIFIKCLVGDCRASNGAVSEGATKSCMHFNALSTINSRFQKKKHKTAKNW